MYHLLSAFVTVSVIVFKAQAHLWMGTPVPFGNETLNNSPLDNTGVDYPCKLRPAAFHVTQMNYAKAGEKVHVSFLGVSVHGGGSCQWSITTDKEPTKESRWKVLHSHMGSCPSDAPGNLKGGQGNEDGSKPIGHGLLEFDVPLPKGMPDGQYTFAWTWFNKIGNREMYMNCAPLVVTGGGGDISVLEKLPDMFVANLYDKQCEAPENTDLIFPEPGDSVQTGAPATLASVKGPGCASITKIGAGAGKLLPPSPPTDVPPNGPSPQNAAQNPPLTQATGLVVPSAGSNNGGVFAPNATTTPVPPSAIAVPSASAPTSNVACKASNTAPTQGPGATGPLSSPPIPPLGSASGSVGVVPPNPQSPPPVQSTPAAPILPSNPIAAPSAASPPAVSIAPAKPPVAASPVSNSAPYNPQPSGDTSPSGATPCTQDGQFICISEAQFAVCNRGKAVPQNVAPGTVCRDGQIGHAAAVKVPRRVHMPFHLRRLGWHH